MARYGNRTFEQARPGACRAGQGRVCSGQRGGHFPHTGSHSDEHRCIRMDVPHEEACKVPLSLSLHANSAAAGRHEMAMGLNNRYGLEERKPDYWEVGER